MRQPMLYIDRGNGWEDATGHEHAPAALAAFSIDWGCDSPEEQPDPSVLRFQLIDRTGDLAGNSTRLAGMKVLIQLSRRPVWRDLDGVESWQEQPRSMTWADFHRTHRPATGGQPDEGALTIFTGNVTSGGEITQRGDGTYLLDLYANSTLVRANRTTRQGPTSTDAAFSGLHWTGDKAARVDEINARLRALGCPVLDTQTTVWLKTNAAQPAPYGTDSYPELSTVLNALAANSPYIPLYYETHDTGLGNDHIHAVFAGSPHSITLHSDGTLSVLGYGMEQTVADGGMITVDGNTLTIPDPVSKVTLSTKAVKWDDNSQKLTFEDDELEIGDQGLLPANLTETVESVSFDCDAVTRDDSQGHWTRGTWQPSDDERQRWARWLATQTLRLRPEKLTASSRHLDIDLYERQLQPTASLWAFVNTRYTKLLADDGTPATSGAWLATGGTLSFDWRNGEPVLSNELTLTPLPMTPSTLSHWDDLNPIGMAWQAMPEFTWGEFSQITYFEQ